MISDHDNQLKSISRIEIVGGDLITANTVARGVCLSQVFCGDFNHTTKKHPSGSQVNRNSPHRMMVRMFIIIEITRMEQLEEWILMGNFKSNPNFTKSN
jgi:hypothetical protein